MSISAFHTHVNVRIYTSRGLQSNLLLTQRDRISLAFQSSELCVPPIKVAPCAGVHSPEARAGFLSQNLSLQRKLSLREKVRRPDPSGRTVCPEPPLPEEQAELMQENASLLTHAPGELP